MEANIAEPETLGRNVREARQALGWSTMELATKASLNVDIVTKLERSSDCSSNDLEQISRALGIPPAILKPGEHQDESNKPPSKRIKWAPAIITTGFMLVLIKLMLPSLL
ncbi:helix-turn-helix domain-containing protein [Kordiimonas sp.]|uniref:helix-turn-helix domain-containing protein n=1 Tax=Kordiimonas sp. TaxID=1970157 RepID=UPI003A9386BC